MKISLKSLNARLQNTDLLIVFAKQGKKAKLPDGVSIPSNAVAAFGGEERETRLTDAISGPAKRVLQIGLGDGSVTTSELMRRAAAIATKKAGTIS